MKIFSTKYCLTAGITEHEAEILDNGAAVVKVSNCYDTYLHVEGKDWHRTMESAVTRAEKVKAKKLQSLDKQIKKISAIKFG